MTEKEAIARELESLAKRVRALPGGVEVTPPPSSLLPDGLYRRADGVEHYLVVGGKRYHIKDMADFHRLDLRWEDVKVVSWEQLGPLPVLDEYDPPVEERHKTIIGINVQTSSGRQALPYVRDLGIKDVRTSVHYLNTREDLDWIHKYREEGINILPIIAPHPENGDFRERLNWLFQNFGFFSEVQLGNEHDNEHTAHPEGGRVWGTLTRRGAEVARDHGSKVVAHGLGWTQVGVHDYLRAFIETVGDSVDAMALHSYGSNPTWEPMGRARFFQEYGWNGPVQATEVGLRGPDSRAFLTGHYGRLPTEEESFRYQAETFHDILTTPDLDLYSVAYLFQLTPDQKEARLHGTHHYCSILNEDWTPRPAYKVVKERKN